MKEVHFWTGHIGKSLLCGTLQCSAVCAPQNVAVGKLEPQIHAQDLCTLAIGKQVRTHGPRPENGHLLPRCHPCTAAGMDAITKRFYHGSLLVADGFRKREAEVFWVVHEARETAVDGWCGKELDVGAQIVPSLPGCKDSLLTFHTFQCLSDIKEPQCCSSGGWAKERTK